MQCLTSSNELIQMDRYQRFELVPITINSCVSEVDLEYPKNLGELNSDYPLYPGRV